jgi:hypothetical protein
LLEFALDGESHVLNHVHRVEVEWDHLLQVVMRLVFIRL